MSTAGRIVVLVSDAAERELWEPLFTKIEEDVQLVEKADVSDAVTDMRSKGESASIVIISTRLYPEADPELVVRIRQIFDEAEIMLMSLSSDPAPPLAPLLADKISHLLINPVGGPLHDMGKVASLFDLSIRRLKKGAPLSMRDYIKPGTVIREFEVTSSDQKDELIAALEKSIDGYSEECEMLRMKGALLVDEMLENALYAAPRGELAAPLYRKGEKRRLAESETVVFRFGFDGETLALEVTDGWGTLSSEDFFRNLACHMDSSSVRDEIGGRGLFIIWRFLDTLLIRIEPGKQTSIGGHLSLSTVALLPEVKGFHIATSC